MFSQYHLPSRFGRALARLRSKHRARCIRDAKDFLARAAQTPTPSRMGPSFTNKSWIKQAGLESVVDYLIEVSAEKWADSVCRLLAWIWIVTLGLKWRQFRTKKTNLYVFLRSLNSGSMHKNIHQIHMVTTGFNENWLYIESLFAILWCLNTWSTYIAQKMLQNF